MSEVHKFGHRLESLRRDLNIPGMSVAVLQEQKVIFARGFGYADIENEIPATEETPYHNIFTSKRGQKCL